VDQYRRGVTACLEKRYAQAVADLEALAGSTDPLARTARRYVALAHRQLGLAALKENRLDQAEYHLRASLRAAANQPDLGASLAAIYANSGRYGSCSQVLERVIETQGDRVELWRKLAQSQWRAGRRAQAYLTISSAMRKLGPEAQLHLQLGLFHSAEDHLAEAKACFARAAEADSTNAEAHQYLGLTAAAMKDVPAAVRSLQRALELRPGDLRLAYQLTLAARAAGQAGLKVVLNIPDAAANTVGSESRQLASYIAAEPEFLEAVLPNPRRVSLPPDEEETRLLGLLVNVIHMALQERPDYADLHFYHAHVLDRLGRTDEAVDAAREALAINPRFTKALVALGQIYARRDRRAEAVDCLQRAIAAGADWPDVHCLAGELIGTDSPTDARKHLSRALQLKSNYQRAVDAMARLAA